MFSRLWHSYWRRWDPRKWSTRRRIIVGVLAVFIVAGIAGSNKKKSTPETTTATAAGRPAKTTTTGGHPRATKTNGVVTTPRKTHTRKTHRSVPPPAGPQRAAASDFAKAAAILHADDAHYLAIEQQGMTVILDRGQPNSFSAFNAWEQKYRALTIDNAGNRAINLLGNTNSNAVSDWQNQDLGGDIDALAQDGLDVGGPIDASARVKVRADARKFQADFARNEKDANAVASGH